MCHRLHLVHFEDRAPEDAAAEVIAPPQRDSGRAAAGAGLQVWTWNTRINVGLAGVFGVSRRNRGHRTAVRIFGSRTLQSRVSPQAPDGPNRVARPIPVMRTFPSRARPYKFAAQNGKGPRVGFDKLIDR